MRTKKEDEIQAKHLWLSNSHSSKSQEENKKKQHIHKCLDVCDIIDTSFPWEVEIVFLPIPYIEIKRSIFIVPGKRFYPATALNLPDW